MKQEYTISVFAENHIGMINKIAIMFSRRKLSLESFNSSPTEVENIYRFTIVILETESVVKNLVRQLNKLVDVFKAFYNTDEEIVWQQLALFKVPTKNIMKEAYVERLLRGYGANTVVIREDYTVFELTGKDADIKRLLNELSQYQLIEFVRSARVAIMKAGESIHKDILEMEKNNPGKDTIRNEFLNKKSVIFQM